MIVAVFKDNDDYTRAFGLWQWDYGQELRIQGLNLPTAVEIHFSLRETGGEAVTRVGVTKDGITTVPIPDSMLEGEGVANDYHIYAWVYLSDTKSGETIKRIDMPVKARSKPEPFDTPEASELFEQAIEAVNEAADRAEKAGAEAVKVGEEAKEAAAKAGEHLEAVQSLAGQVEINADAVAKDKQAVAGMVTQTQSAASEAALSEQAAKQSQTAAEQAQAGAEAAEDTARQYAAETEEDRQEVAEDKQAVSQMRDDVSADRQAVEGAVAGFDGAVNQAVGEIASAGKTQVSAVNTAGQTAVQAVETAKGEAVKAVEAEGTEQAGIVAAEGAKQLGEIKRVMDTIPEDYTDLSELAESNYRNKAPGIVETASGALIEIRDASDLPVRGLVVYGKSEQVTTKGLNLLPFEVGYEGGNFSVFDDGIQLKTEGYSDIYAVGTNGDINSEEIYAEYSLLPEGDYHILCDSSKVSLFVVVWRNGTSNILTEAKNNISKKITVEKGDKFMIFLRTTEKLNERVKAIISREALTVADYEPYTGGKSSPSLESPQEIENAGGNGNLTVRVGVSEDDEKPQTVIIPTPTGLPGIPVTSGGNYTDANGQQWVCDEKDYGRGKYIQRVAEEVYSKVSLFLIDEKDNKFQSASSGIYKFKGATYKAMSNFARYSEWANNKGSFAAFGNYFYYQHTENITVSELNELFNAMMPIKILGQLAEPIERDLTPEEIAAVQNLHTFHPTTIITNDAGVDVSVDYVADTKTYIDNQFAQLNKTILDAVIGGK